MAVENQELNQSEVDRYRAMAESSQNNIMTCDAKGVINYLNPMSQETLASIEDLLPISADDILGSKFDIFHKDPSFQQKLLKNPKRNFPRQAILHFSEDVILDLAATALYDRENVFIGLQATWSVVTEQIKTQRMADIKTTMVDAAPVNMMTCDPNGVINYMNPASIKTLTAVESLLPCKASEILGQPFDIFHKDPAFQQNLLKDPKRNFPRQGILDFRGLILDLTATALFDSKGEFMGLQAAWENITEKVAAEKREIEVSKGIAENSGLVASAAIQLNASAAQMNSTVTDVLSEVNEANEMGKTVREQMDSVMGATEEMTIAVKEISSGAQESAKIANEAVETSRNANEIIAALGESSNEISNVIKAISSVAQQTNLLALNATIEAARAGEAGKGFAVVASEVKELAKETRSATEEITSKIEKIQNDTAKAVKAIEQITEIINRLNEIANTTASSVEEQSVTTNEMAKSISETNAGASQISDSMESVLAKLQEVSSGVEQNLSAAGELSSSAEKLSALAKKD